MVLMWEHWYDRKMFSYHQPFDMITSPFAFPRLPPKVYPSLGISNIDKIKDGIVNDSNTMMNRLFVHHEMFQHYAASLFNLSPNRFAPGHPIQMKIQPSKTLEDENCRLSKENFALKKNQLKEKKQ